ncbi:MAG: PAS domain-containing protein [Betaproteobacteria bacterium]|nr:PAS domain-containing protein [Betaproteobacteria bacterium]MDE2423979.1 PAS domain-containing protein [Betaproteobacteria bacterium]
MKNPKEIIVHQSSLLRRWRAISNPTVIDQILTHAKQISEKLYNPFDSLLLDESVHELGSWIIHLESGMVIWSEQMYRIFGYEAFSFLPTIDTLFSSVIEEDKKRVEDAFWHILKQKEPCEMSYQIMTAQQALKHIQSHCQIHSNHQDQTSFITGISKSTYL